MEWSIKKTEANLEIKSWCHDIEEKALQQAKNLAMHPSTRFHIALMPDCHVGYGMPIGGVIATEDAIIPNAVGVDIGCGMGAIKTSLTLTDLQNPQIIRDILADIKQHVPMGEGNSHSSLIPWEGFNEYLDQVGLTRQKIKSKNYGWITARGWELAEHSLGTLGGGNHFIELQKDQENNIWLMLHSGSRNLGYRIAEFYHKRALDHNNRHNIVLPDKELAFLPLDTKKAHEYIRDMTFALKFARKNRELMMNHFKNAVRRSFPDVLFSHEVNIHHNYASLEEHYGKKVWIHRKGATSARKDEYGIIPGSMGTASYIVKGRGTPESFMSCSHGAGRRMGRMEACRNLTAEECDEAMRGIIYDPWKKVRGWRKKRPGVQLDLGEAPQAYKDIDEVIKAQLDLIEPLTILCPLGVLKG